MQGSHATEELSVIHLFGKQEKSMQARPVAPFSKAVCANLAKRPNLKSGD